MMKNKLLFTGVVITMLIASMQLLAVNPTLGKAADFVLFSTDGALLNVGITHLTGDVGTNNGEISGFGNVNGNMHNADGLTATAAGDLLIAYNLLNAAIPTFFPAPLLGNGQTLIPGIYSVSGDASLNNQLILDAQGDASAEFTILIQGALSTAALSEVVLLNNAKACNVFWKVEGLVSMASGTKMKGNVVVNNAAIVMSAGVELEGRGLSTTGAISVDGVLAYTPVGCGSLLLTGPAAPDLKTTACYAVFSGNGAVTNAGITFLTGDVGTNVGLTTGFDALNITGMLHPIPDIYTAAAMADLNDVYNYLNVLPHDIELLYPAQFGNNLVLTPHVYLMNAAAIFTGNLYLNAMGNANAVFVIKVNGAISTSTYAKVILTNGTQAKNVYWLVNGALEINDYSEYNGTIIVNNGAIDIKTGTSLNGRALTTSGAVNTAAVTVISPVVCEDPTLAVINPNAGSIATIYPNPMRGSVLLTLNEISSNQNYRLSIYNTTGKMILDSEIIHATTRIYTNFPSGIYFYKLSANEQTLQVGKLISE
jgi:formylmethanofuran dehydrogenase subunit C